MTGEQPGVEYRSLNAMSTINSVFEKLIDMDFEKVLTAEAHYGLNEYFHYLQHGFPENFGSFFLHLDLEGMFKPDLGWWGAEYAYQFTNEDEIERGICMQLVDWYKGDTGEGQAALARTDPDKIYPLAWDDVHWILGYAFVLNANPDEILPGLS